ncbi:hypothetical protein POM88_011863 [Heracleum sosnowskyi]|uniref:DUF4378 domain-containing protein n=1 Tax=Heracleum sosnowskyi TaxID=360622 RepID=A0AAD8N1Y9_9APIA|nr:hypothetical protein POM88_011863 [Heracleum sosnowskyi]
MGKDWLSHWSGVRGGSSGSGSSSSSSSSRSRKKRGNNTFSCSSGGDSGSVVSYSTSTPSGCINAVIQLFDFHPFHFSSHLRPQSPDHTTFLPHESTTNVPVKGAEAPRNSLDIHDGTNFMEDATLSSSNLKKDETLQIEKEMKIKTSGHTRSSLRLDDSPTFSNNSPGGTKTPTLVARLMGLDLLPDSSSPRVSSSSSTINHSHQLQNLALNKKKSAPSSANANDFISHSLPVTPRTSSSSSARRSDIDQRYSLQTNKENNDVANCQEIEFSKFLKSKISAVRMHEDENLSPGHYAKQIVKQFKESVSRRVGKDITNTVTNHDYQRRDQNVVLLKPKKPSNLGNGSETTTKSPRLRLLETKSKPVTTKYDQDFQHSPKLLSSQLCSDKQSKCEAVSVRSKPQKAALSQRERNQKQKSSVVKSKQIIHGDENTKCSSKFKKPPQTLDLMRNKQEETYVRSPLTNGRASQISDNKCKRTPLPTLLSLEKKELKRQKQLYDSEASDPSPSKKNTQMLSCNLSRSYKQELNDQNSLMAAEQLTDYISRILNCTGIFHYTPISIFTFNSPSHPLHPSIFHKLPELRNGKLIFELVDQLLAGFLQPHLYYNSNCSLSKKFMFGEQLRYYIQCTKLEHHVVKENVPMYGEQLIDILCNKIKNFGSVNCLVLEDIDGLIDKDVPSKLECEEEVEGIVMEIEGYIFERLVHETVTLGLG